MATIAYLRLDENNDPDFANGTSLTGAQAVSQAVYTRLQLFMGEWWENIGIGLPVFQSMLGQLGSKRTQAVVELAIQQRIRATPYVTSVTKVAANFVNGKFQFSATVQTAFGTITVSNVPALSAAVAS